MRLLLVMLLCTAAASLRGAESTSPYTNGDRGDPKPGCIHLQNAVIDTKLSPQRCDAPHGSSANTTQLLAHPSQGFHLPYQQHSRTQRLSAERAPASRRRHAGSAPAIHAAPAKLPRPGQSCIDATRTRWHGGAAGQLHPVAHAPRAGAAQRTRSHATCGRCQNIRAPGTMMLVSHQRLQLLHNSGVLPRYCTCRQDGRLDYSNSSTLTPLSLD